MQMLAMIPAIATGTGAGATVAGVFGGGAAAASGFSLMGTLAAGAGIASGLATLAQGRAEAGSLTDQAAFEVFNSRQELLRGRAEALDAVRAANDAVAAAQVAGFASGLTGEGSVRGAKDAALRDADFQIGMTRSNAEMLAGARRGSAKRLVREAKETRRGALFGALGQFAGGLSRFGNTG